MTGAWQLTSAAADDLAQIFLQGFGLFGPDQANTYHRGLEGAFLFLANYPRAARRRDELQPPVRAYPYKRHLIVYEIAEDETILILRIRHAREDWQNGPIHG